MYEKEKEWEGVHRDRSSEKKRQSDLVVKEIKCQERKIDQGRKKRTKRERKSDREIEKF